MSGAGVEHRVKHGGRRVRRSLGVVPVQAQGLRLSAKTISLTSTPVCADSTTARKVLVGVPASGTKWSTSSRPAVRSGFRQWGRPRGTSCCSPARPVTRSVGSLGGGTPALLHITDQNGARVGRTDGDRGQCVSCAGAPRRPGQSSGSGVTVRSSCARASGSCIPSGSSLNELAEEICCALQLALR